jgi:hypothetical protein
MRGNYPLTRCGTVMALLLLAWPFTASADFSGANLPTDSTWYFHTDLNEMRTSEAGGELHAWLDREIFDELRDEIGIDLAKEADSITAFSGEKGSVVFVLEGNIETSTKDKLMVLAGDADEFRSLDHRGKPYYFVRGDAGSPDGDLHVDSLDDGAYFSFAIPDKIIAASSEAQIKELIDNDGRITGDRSHAGSLFVLTAEKSLVQAGVNADEFSDDDDWDSNFLSNARQVALLIADAGGRIAIEAQMIAADAERAEALANIARGIVALQAFSDDMEPHVRDILQNTRIDVSDTTLSLKLAVDPSLVVATLDD